MAKYDKYHPRDFARDGLRYSGWIIFVGVLALVVVLTLGTMYTLSLGWWSKETANFRGSVQQANQVQGNGSYRIAAYEHFFDACASVQDDEASIESLNQELNGTPKPSEERTGQIQASLTALRASRIEKINHYNADARKSNTQAKFMASDLPYQLDKTAKETSCNA